MQPSTPPVIVANAHSGLRAVLGYREVARLALLNNSEPLLWTKCALLISSFHLIPTCLIRSPMLQFVGGSLRYSCSSVQGRTPVIAYPPSRPREVSVLKKGNLLTQQNGGKTITAFYKLPCDALF